MYYLFSSSGRDLYKRGVLETCAYPDNHVHRYRYSERIVPNDLWETPERLLRQDCVIIYAYPGGVSDEFECLPLRRGKIVECNIEAGFLYIDVRLLGFIGASNADHLRSWGEAIRRHHNRPHPKEPGKSEGYFIYHDAPLDGVFTERNRESSWKSVIDALNTTPLGDCITYQVLGFYGIFGWRQRMARIMRASLSTVVSLPLFGSAIWSNSTIQSLLRYLANESERRIEPVVRGCDCWYELPMGGTVLLRLIVYRLSELPTGAGRELKFDYSSAVFSSVSESTLAVESRYDDFRTLLSCARIVDPTFTSFSIRQKATDGNNPIWAAEPVFLMRVAPPKYFLFVTLFIFAFGLYCLNLASSESIPLSNALLGHLWIASLAHHPRPIGTLCILYASWNYLRKFPLK